MKYRLEIANQSHKIEIIKDNMGKISEIFIDDQKFPLSDLLAFDGLNVQKQNEKFIFKFHNDTFVAKLKEIIEPESVNGFAKKNNLDQLKEFFKGNILISPMPGKIVDIRCSEGNIVHKGKFLLSLEAMKMENEILAPFDLKITKILVSVGNPVTDKQTLLEYEQISDN